MAKQIGDEYDVLSIGRLLCDKSDVLTTLCSMNRSTNETRNPLAAMKVFFAVVGCVLLLIVAPTHGFGAADDTGSVGGNGPAATNRQPVAPQSPPIEKSAETPSGASVDFPADEQPVDSDSETSHATPSPRDRRPNRGVLPSGGKADRTAPPNPREIFNEYEIDEQRLAKLSDGELLTDSETEFELLFRILFRLRGISAFSMEHWSNKARDLNILLQQTDRFRGEVFRIDGRVVMIERLKLTSQIQQRFELDRLYRCHLYVGDPELPAELYTTQIPKSLVVGDPLDERISFHGLFLKRGAGSVGVAPLVFAANRLAWHAETLLGDLGTDCGLLDDIQNDRPLQPGEHECFYQVLSAVQKSGTTELARHAHNNVVSHMREWNDEQQEIIQKLGKLTSGRSDAPSDERATEIAELKDRQGILKARLEHSRDHAVHAFYPLMENPKEIIGQLRMFHGTARRIVRVRITDPDIVRRFGMTHYYQIDMLVNLEHKIVLVKSTGTADSDEMEVEKATWTHPATFCALSLPEGMPTGDRVQEPIRMAGFFFKNWVYETSETEDGYAKQRKAPMLIGREPIWEHQPQPGVSAYAGAIAGGLFVLALTGIWFGVWRLGRGDDKFHHVLVSTVYGMEDGANLNDMGLKATGIDFSYLDGVEVEHNEVASTTSSASAASERTRPASEPPSKPRS